MYCPAYKILLVSRAAEDVLSTRCVAHVYNIALRSKHYGTCKMLTSKKPEF